MRFSGRVDGRGTRFGARSVERLQEAVRKRVSERVLDRLRNDEAVQLAGGGMARRRLNLAERLRVIEEAEG